MYLSPGKSTDHSHLLQDKEQILAWPIKASTPPPDALPRGADPLGTQAGSRQPELAQELLAD